LELYIIFCITTVAVFHIDWIKEILIKMPDYNRWYFILFMDFLCFIGAPLCFLIMLLPTGKHDFIAGMIEGYEK